MPRKQKRVRLDAGYLDQVHQQAQEQRRTANAIVELREVRRWARDGLRLLQRAFEAMPLDSKAFAAAAADVERASSASTRAALSKAWFDATTRGTTYSALAEQLTGVPLSPAKVANRLRMTESALAYLLDELGSDPHMSADDAVDAILSKGVTVQARPPAGQPKTRRTLVLEWTDGGGRVRGAERPMLIQGRVARHLAAEAFGVSDDALKKRRARRRRRTSG